MISTRFFAVRLLSKPLTILVSGYSNTRYERILLEQRVLIEVAESSPIATLVLVILL